MKIYFICDGARDWWICHGVLSNGFYFGQHICSHPHYAQGDLLFGRKDRLSALGDLFGVLPGVTEYETIILTSKDDIPTFWSELVDNPDVQKELEPQYQRYKELLGGEIPEPKVEIEFA